MSLISKHNLDQLKMVRKLSKGIDIGDKIKQVGANQDWIKNPLDSYIETYDDYMKNAKVKKYTENNMKHIKMYDEFPVN